MRLRLLAPVCRFSLTSAASAAWRDFGLAAVRFHCPVFAATAIAMTLKMTLGARPVSDARVSSLTHFVIPPTIPVRFIPKKTDS